MISRSARLYFSLCLGIAALGLRAQTPPGPHSLAAATTAASLTPPPATTPPPRLDVPNDEIIPKFDLAGVDIDAVLGALETYTGRAILRPGTLPVAPGGYTIRLSHVPKSEVVLALETLLSLNQVGVVPLGEHFLKIVPLSVTRAESPELITGTTLNLPPSGRIATKLFQLNFLRVAELFNQGINTLMTPGIGGGILILDKANAALVTDTISNLQRVEELIAAVDKPVTNGFTPKFYQLHSATASDLVSKIHALLSGPMANQVGSATVYSADDRTNQIIVLTDDRQLPFFDDLIAKLDIKGDPNTHNEVIYLKHADSKDLTALLSSLISGQTAAAQKASGGTRAPGVVAPAPVAGAPTTTGGGSGATTFSSFMTLQSDERSNSVVVSGTVDDIRLIEELIAKLDLALAQVRIQVIIAEVTLSDTDISGISSLGLTVGQNSAGATHVINWAGATNSATPGTSIAGWDFANGIVNPLAFNAAFNATSTGQKSLVHVLQAPVIVTAHNKPAEVTVGQSVPIINGGQSTLGASGIGSSPVNSFNSTYQNVAVDLTVTPLIGDNGDIQLTIDQKVDNIDSYTTIQAGDTQPIIGHREMKSFLTVKDGQMIVLGGLQKTSKSASQNKIGFLYSIPILSQLLGGHTDDIERTELLFFIRPTILPPEEGSPDAKKRIQELSNREQVKEFLKDPAPKPDSKVQNFLDRFKN